MDQRASPAFSVVVPVYNTADVLAQLAERVDRVFREELQESYELIFVDDCSPNDKTWPALQRLWERFETVRVVRLSRNFGQQAATLCGMQQARGRWVVTMDDDLQHLPEEIPKLAAEREHDIVIVEFRGKRHSLFKRATSRLKGWFDRVLLGKPKGLRLSSFRLISRTVVDGMMQIKTPYPFIPAMMFYISKDALGVPGTHAERAEGRGNYTLRSLFRLFSNLIISNSSLLLRLVGQAGIAIALLAVGGAGYVALKKILYDNPITGWTSLIVAVLLMGGLTLFALGIIGEYLVRIISGVEAKPTFFVRVQLPPRGSEVVPVAEPRAVAQSSSAGDSG
jgi:dolichol-phosphate mannosyltransferase/undecaprenyl-phosphate 4-deoxy-4-formamido-L-arabinose transferase